MVLGEESYDKYCTDNKWTQAQDSYGDVPPVIIFIQQAVEDLNKEGKGNDESENTDSYQTALNWEATTA